MMMNHHRKMNDTQASQLLLPSLETPKFCVLVSSPSDSVASSSSHRTPRLPTLWQDSSSANRCSKEFVVGPTSSSSFSSNAAATEDGSVIKVDPQNFAQQLLLERSSTRRGAQRHDETSVNVKMITRSTTVSHKDHVGEGKVSSKHLQCSLPTAVMNEVNQDDSKCNDPDPRTRHIIRTNEDVIRSAVSRSPTSVLTYQINEVGKYSFDLSTTSSMSDRTSEPTPTTLSAPSKGVSLEPSDDEGHLAQSTTHSNHLFECITSSISSSLQQTRPNVHEDNMATKPSSLLVLYSSQSCDRQVTSRQRQIFAILTAKQIPFNVLDGADVSNKERRNQLFSLSSKPHGTYPLFFLVHDTTTTTTSSYWGDYDRFHEANDMGTLVSDLVNGRTQVFNVPMDDALKKKTNLSEDDCSEPEPATMIHSSDDRSAIGLAAEPQAGQSASTLSTNAGAFSSESTSTTKSGPPPKDSDPTESQSRNREIGISAKEATGAITKNDTYQTDITIYGATSFVAQHVLSYLCQVSLSLPRILKVTLAGRSPSKLNYLLGKCSQKMDNLCTLNADDASGRCVFDVFVADSADFEALHDMTKRTNVVLNCAGPFGRYGEKVVKACAVTGSDYVDITGEIAWASEMRDKYGPISLSSGSRIISFCGFDSVPSDMATFAAVRALQDASQTKSVDVACATTYHSSAGGINGGTVHTILDLPVKLDRFMHRVPYFVDDPLALVSPKVRTDPSVNRIRNRMAMAEWMNQLPSVETIFRFGISMPFFMAPVNAKVVHASAVALKYGQKFVCRDRFVPTGFKMTTRLGLLSIVPAIATMTFIAIALVVFKMPVVGRMLANYIFPPGSGCSDKFCRAGYAEVYAEVNTARDEAGTVDRANCLLKFQGDPSNYITAQCVSEAALALVFDKSKLPNRSHDGFGTPAELLGEVLLHRLKSTPVRPVVVETVARMNVGTDWSMVLE